VGIHQQYRKRGEQFQSNARAGDILRTRPPASTFSSVFFRKPAGHLPTQSVEIPFAYSGARHCCHRFSRTAARLNPAACYGAIETECNVLVDVRVHYDKETLREKSTGRAPRLPKILALRLIDGT
jgi:hypothetical protein